MGLICSKWIPSVELSHFICRIRPHRWSITRQPWDEARAWWTNGENCVCVGHYVGLTPRVTSQSIQCQSNCKDKTVSANQCSGALKQPKAMNELLSSAAHTLLMRNYYRAWEFRSKIFEKSRHVLIHGLTKKDIVEHSTMMLWCSAVCRRAFCCSMQNNGSRQGVWPHTSTQTHSRSNGRKVICLFSSTAWSVLANPPVYRIRDTKSFSLLFSLHCEIQTLWNATLPWPFTHTLNAAEWGREYASVRWCSKKSVCMCVCLYNKISKSVYTCSRVGVINLMYSGESTVSSS